MSNLAELKPCPGCDSTLGPFLTASDGKTQVVCSTCGMRGPYETVHVSAADHFNTLPRAAAPLTPAEAMRCPEVAALVDAVRLMQRHPIGVLNEVHQAMRPFTKGSDG